MAEKEIGKVTHFYDKLSVAVVKLTDSLSTGDKIKIKKGEGEFEDVVGSMQVDHQAVTSAKRGQEVAIKISQKTKEGASIFRIEE